MHCTEFSCWDSPCIGVHALAEPPSFEPREKCQRPAWWFKPYKLYKLACKPYQQILQHSWSKCGRVCKAHPTTARIPRSSSLSSHLGVRKARNQKSRSPERRLLEVGVWRAPRPPVFVNKWSSCALQSGWQWLWRWVAASASAWIYRTTSCRASFEMQQRPDLQNVTEKIAAGGKKCARSGPFWKDLCNFPCKN